MDYKLIAKNAKEFFTLIQQKGGSLEDISYEDKKEIFSHIANILHNDKKNLFSKNELVDVLLNDESFLNFIKELASDEEFNLDPKNKYVFLEEGQGFLSSVIHQNLNAKEWVEIIEKNPLMYNVFDNPYYKGNDEIRKKVYENDELRQKVISVIVNYNLKQSPDLTYKGEFSELKILPNYKILNNLTFEETKDLLNKDARYFLECEYFRKETKTRIRNILNNEKLKEKLVIHFIEMVKIDLKENGNNGLNSNLKRKINRVALQGEEIFEKNSYCLNQKELVSLINVDNFFISYLKNENNYILKNYIKEKIDNNDIDKLFTRFDIMTKADKFIFGELHNFIDVLKLEDKEKIVKKIIKKEGDYLYVSQKETHLFCELFQIEPSFIEKISDLSDYFNNLFDKPFDDIIYNVLKDKKEQYSKGDLINASMFILKEVNNKLNNEFLKEYKSHKYFVSDITKQAIKNIIKYASDDNIKYDLAMLKNLTSYPEVQNFIIKEMQEKNRDNLFPAILLLRNHINEQFFAQIKDIVSKERKEEKKVEANKKSSLEKLVDSIVFNKNKENEIKLKNS